MEDTLQSSTVPRWLGKRRGAVLLGLEQSSKSNGKPAMIHSRCAIPVTVLADIMRAAGIRGDEVHVVAERPLTFEWRGDPWTDERKAQIYTTLVCAEPAVDRVQTAEHGWVLVPSKYDREAQCVDDGYLCIGNMNAACNVDNLRAQRITHIISLIGPLDCKRPDDIAVTNFDVADAPWQQMSDVFRAANDVIDLARREPDARVLVHCAAGVSRSSAVVIYHLMTEHSMQYDDALTAVRSVRRVVQPNHGFERQLRALGPAKKDEL